MQIGVWGCLGRLVQQLLYHRSGCYFGSLLHFQKFHDIVDNDHGRVVVVVREDGPQLDDRSRGSPLKNESPRTFPEAPLLNQKLRTCRARLRYIIRSNCRPPFFVLAPRFTK